MADELGPVYLIGGGDRPKVDRALTRLRGRFEPMAVEQLDAATATGADAVAACNALGLLGGDTRLVVVSGVEAWRAPDVDAVAAYLKAPAPSTTLALLAGALRKDAALVKAVASTGEVLLWDVSARAVPRWLGEQFALQGAAADADACRLLHELAGDDLHELAAEVDKLATWAAGERVTAEDVEALVAARAESPPWSLTDAWGVRDAGAVLRAAERMLDRSGDPPSRTIARIVGSLTRHVRSARAARALEEQGLSARDAAAALGLKPYPTQKLYAQIRNFSAEELDSALLRLADLDHALKGGSRLAPELELERALVQITADA
jgi:DNA polymerase III subunit delta